MKKALSLLAAIILMVGSAASVNAAPVGAPLSIWAQVQHNVTEHNTEAALRAEQRLDFALDKEAKTTVGPYIAGDGGYASDDGWSDKIAGEAGVKVVHRFSPDGPGSWGSIEVGAGYRAEHNFNRSDEQGVIITATLNIGMDILK
jgi:hypothetical protein